MLLGSWFNPRPDRPETQALKLLLRDRLALGPDDSLTVNEINCPGCGPDGVETVVLVMRADERTVALRCPGTIAELNREPALLDALTSEPGGHRR